ncbi:MAG: tail fiber domain-containing protein [Flavobacteriales bacterium]|nr:tail fiber domain-containing protein [Flavobacteriales bacterium]
MKRLLLVLLLFPFIIFSQDNVGVGTITPDPSAVLDAVANDKGVLIPRLADTNSVVAAPPATSLLIYNMSDSCYWYFDGILWRKMIALAAADSAKLDAWLTTGNPGTDPLVNFLGPTDNDTLRISTNGIDRLRLDAHMIEPLNNGESVFIGEGAGAVDDLANNFNVFIGARSGNSTVNGKGNIGVGHQSLQSNTGSANIGVGRNALFSNTSGNDNVAIGRDAGYLNDVGFGNVSVGREAGYGVMNGVNNTAVGKEAGRNMNGAAFGNVLLGHQAGFDSKGDVNVFIGNQAGYDTQQGILNVYIGNQAGYSATGDTNVFIGNQAGYNETGNNKLYIENSNSATPLIYGEFDNDILRTNGELQVNDPAVTGFAFPIADGQPTEVLYTDGNGQLAWDSAANLLGGALGALDSTYWALLGNGGTDPTIHFLGTHDRDTLAFGVDSVIRWHMDRHMLVPQNSGFSVFIGENAGEMDDLSTNGNVYIGVNSGRNGTTSELNTGVGSSSLTSLTTGRFNTAVGANSLLALSTGENNVAIGERSSQSNVMGSENVTIGVASDFLNTNGTKNTVIGYEAGFGSGQHTRDSSVYVGYQAGRNANGTGNVFLGYQAGFNEAGRDKLYIENSNTSSPLIYGDFALDSVSINGTLHAISATDPLELTGVVNDVSIDTVLTIDNLGVVHKAHLDDLISASGAGADSDFVEVGTNAIPNNVNDNIYTLGQVGIGTTTPTNTLHVAGTPDPVRIEGTAVDATIDTVVVIDGSGVLHRANINDLLVSSGAGGDSDFFAVTTNLPPTDINDDIYTLGNVGIGTTNPTDNLDVRSAISAVDASGTRSLRLLSGGAQFISSTNDLWVEPGSNIQFNLPQVGTSFIIGKNANDHGLIFDYTDYDLGIGLFSNPNDSATHRLHIRDATDPLRVEGLAIDNTLDSVLLIDKDGIVHMADINQIVPPGAAGDSDFFAVATNLPPTSINDDIYTHGNVGIGTTSPTQLFQVSSTTNSAVNRMRLQAFDASSTSKNAFLLLDPDNENFGIDWLGTGLGIFTVNSSANVGIGTHLPTYDLHIEKADAKILLDSRISATGSRTATFETRSAIGAATPLNVITTFDFRNYDNSSGTPNDFLGASLRVLREGVDDVGLAFYTSEDKAISEAVRINFRGNLGIGDDNPSNKLHVSSSTDPLRVEGLVVDASLDTVLVTDVNGVVHKAHIDDISSSGGGDNLGNHIATQNIILGTGFGLTDTDEDTKIQVEETADEDVIRMDLEGVEYLVLDKNLNNVPRIELLNSGASTYIGAASGGADDGTNNQNVGIGDNALDANTSGDENVGIGYDAMTNNIDGNRNVAIGYQSMEENVDGNQNTAVGWWSLEENTSGINNTAVGYSSLTNNSTGQDNTAIGGAALNESLTADNNTALGQRAFRYSTTGENNVVIGTDAGEGNALFSGSDNNVIIGKDAGHDISSNQDGNIFLGYNAGFTESGSDKLYIENSSSTTPLIWGDFANDLMTVNGALTVTESADPLTLEGLVVDASLDTVLVTDVNGVVHKAHIDDIAPGGGGSADADWHEIGTTAPPTNISDNIFTEGNVAIGTNTTSNQLEVVGGKVHFKYTATGTTDIFTIAGYNQPSPGIIMGTPGGAPGYGKITLKANAAALPDLIDINAVPSSSSFFNVSGGTFGIGTNAPSNRLHVSETSDPVRIEGLVNDVSLDTVLVIDANGVVHKADIDDIAPGGGGADGDWTISGNDIYKAVSGNVGIGTTSPSAMLEVKGSGNSKFVYNAGGGQSETVVTVHAYAASANPSIELGGVGGAPGYGRIGILEASSGTERILFHANADSYFNTGSNLGVGTTSPLNTLHVEATTDPLRLLGLVEDSSLDSVLVKDANGIIHVAHVDDIGSGGGGSGIYGGSGSLSGNTTVTMTNNSLDFELDGTGDFTITDGAITRFEVRDNGNVGIGNGTPGYFLDIQPPTAGLQQLIRVQTSGGQGLFYVGEDGSGNAHMTLRAGGASPIHFDSNDDSYINTGANLGIGTNVPTERLDVRGNTHVVGNVNVEDYTDAFQLGGSDFLHNGNNINSTLVGLGAGTASVNAVTAVGNGALSDLTAGGTENTAIGNSAGNNTTGGALNTFAGANAGFDNVTGANNVYLGGYSAAQDLGSNNVIIGANPSLAGLSRTVSGVVHIGYQSGYSITSDNTLAIDNGNDATPFIYGDFSTDRMGINRITTTNNLEVNGTASNSAGGNWLVNSDRRLKKNIQKLDSEKMLTSLLKMKGVTFEWNDTQTGYKRPLGLQYGFIAQDIQEVFPGLVKTDNDGFLQTAYGNYDPMLIESIRALNNKIEVLEKENQELKSEYDSRLKRLEEQLINLQQKTDK